MKDIQILTQLGYSVTPLLRGKTEDTTLLLYQKIMVLLLSKITDIYRELEGSDLVNLLEGSNIPQLSFVLHLAQTACANVIELLDDEDRFNIVLLKPEIEEGHLLIKLETTDNEMVGVIA